MVYVMIVDVYDFQVCLFVCEILFRRFVLSFLTFFGSQLIFPKYFLQKKDVTHKTFHRFPCDASFPQNNKAINDKVTHDGHLHKTDL